MSTSNTITKTDLENILNAVLPPVGGLLVTMTQSGNVITCNKTAGEIKNALDASLPVVFSLTIGDITYYTTVKLFQYDSNDGDVELYINGYTNDAFTCNGLNNYPRKTSGGGGND